jgi:NAD(P)-dependent dehydrogenase (short-subunit alcohol dehydrogenase family)
MSFLQSFSDAANVVIVGANGGIGAALTEKLVGDARAGSVNALAREPAQSDSEKVRAVVADITRESSVAKAARQCARDGPLDLVIVATGVLHQAGRIRPEKRMKDLDPETLAEVLRINTIAPTMVAKHFLPLMRRDAKSAFAAISARVGSIGDNRLGGWASYRASKAALNMMIKTLSIEHARTHPDAVVVALHPGTTDTRLSRPFQRNVPADKLFTPEYTAERLLRVLDHLTSQDTGGFFAWNGDSIEYTRRRRRDRAARTDRQHRRKLRSRYRRLSHRRPLGNPAVSTQPGVGEFVLREQRDFRRRLAGLRRRQS